MKENMSHENPEFSAVDSQAETNEEQALDSFRKAKRLLEQGAASGQANDLIKDVIDTLERRIELLEDIISEDDPAAKDVLRQMYGEEERDTQELMETWAASEGLKE